MPGALPGGLLLPPKKNKLTTYAQNVFFSGIRHITDIDFIATYWPDMSEHLEVFLRSCVENKSHVHRIFCLGHPVIKYKKVLRSPPCPQFDLWLLTSGLPGGHTLSGVWCVICSSALRECVSAPGWPGPAGGKKRLVFLKNNLKSYDNSSFFKEDFFALFKYLPGY